jgi:hypothetical protein
MSITTSLNISPLSASASLISRGESIGSDGGISQSVSTLYANIVGNLSYISGDQKKFNGSLVQDATHTFVTNYVFGTVPVNGNMLLIDTTYYTILDFQNIGNGRMYMVEFYIKEIKE